MVAFASNLLPFIHTFLNGNYFTVVLKPKSKDEYLLVFIN
jgi:hypothetical protein